jgi:preprotein translocase subunit SecF
MFIIKYRKIFVSISAILVALSLGSLMYFGLDFGIDFRGGSLMEVTYEGVRPEQSAVEASLENLGYGGSLVQQIDTDGYSIKTRALTETERQSLVTALGTEATEKSFTSIGPSVGAELVRKSILSFILVSLGIIFFIAFSFRKVSKPVSSWKYGLIAIVALVHDVVIVSGIFALMGHFTGAEVDTLFVVAILTVLGLSVSDTIVVFDRIRENIRAGISGSFEDTVGKSLGQVFTRSVATSFTVIAVLVSLVFFGPSSTKTFSLLLVIGMFFGTYSSLFLASPLLVFIQKGQKHTKE